MSTRKKSSPMYAVGTLITKGSANGAEISLANNDGMCGMLPVFTSRKKAEKFAPSRPIFEIAYSTNTTK